MRVNDLPAVFVNNGVPYTHSHHAYLGDLQVRWRRRLRPVVRGRVRVERPREVHGEEGNDASLRASVDTARTSAGRVHRLRMVRLTTMFQLTRFCGSSRSSGLESRKSRVAVGTAGPGALLLDEGSPTAGSFCFGGSGLPER